MIVEDDFDIVKILKLFLSYHGYCHVRVENSGVSGLEAALSRTPGLILLDIMLPHTQVHLPIRRLFPSSCSRQGMKFPETGADDYVTKPFNTEELLAHIKTQLMKSVADRLRDRLSNLIIKRRHGLSLPR